ncbi:putative integrator complex subunit 7 [Helianthus annuus]|nr:putative integrator complex subunit 7 [Helianthus annuus]KAJ0758834.1 putative integrator complex subunit 7 [Helianthus annuus]KAJ0762483.1 putative integrator complex subunit 7 [Helianthus annuus]
MERTPAACAMNWSIQLDKAIRSNNTRKRTEAIKETGVRLEWWSTEPELSMAEYDMFGLIPGEDKLFANAILLRLAATFVSGDKHTKLCVVKMFLSELKHRKTKSSNRNNKGFFAKHNIPNHLELLRRIKLCFNSGDEEVRAMSLVLFGCWSDFSKDNAEIRYLVFSCIVSCRVLEVKASLFAAGCFCELAGVRAFAKLGRSSALSSRAYKEGTNLILGSVDDDIATTMLISLSIIASRSALLISRQVDLLLTFLSEDKSLSLRATSLRCLNIVLSRSRFRFSPPTKLMTAMFNTLNEELQPVMQHDAIHILYEILMSKVLSVNNSEINECFTKILTIVETVMQSPSISNRLFAIHFLANISVKFTRKIDMTYDGNDKTLATQAISFLVDRITLLTNSVLNRNQPNLETEQEIQSLFRTIKLLLHKCPNLSEFALTKLHLFVKCLLHNDNGTIGSKLAVCVSKVVNLCLKNTVKYGTLSSEIRNVARLMIEDVCGCGYFNHYVHVIYHLLLLKKTEECYTDHAYAIENEIFALEKAKKLMEVKDYWSAYKAGKTACVRGAWFTAAFIFGELLTVVRSDSCHQWLTSLTLFAYSEMKIVYCSSPKERSTLLNWLVGNRSSSLPIIGVLGEISKTTDNEIENLDVIRKILQVSKEMLSANDVTSSGRHYFQIQFLALRANVIEIAVHVFNEISKGQISHLQHGASLVQPLTQLSTRLMKLAHGYDLVATSFMNMDPTSTTIISAHALSCSVLAFITRFSLFFQFENVDLQSDLHAMLINDLVGRLWCIDRETSKELLLLLKTCIGQPNSCVGQLSKTQRLENTYEVTSIIKICRIAVERVVDIQNAAKRMHENDDEIQSEIVNDGLELLLDVLKKWLNVSFMTPTYFFSLRPCVSCQLFAMNRDSQNGAKISVLPGHQLHLDLCLQLNDVLPESRARITKLYCILQCKISYRQPSQSQDCKSQTKIKIHDWADDTVLELNDKLIKYVNKCEKYITESVVCFRPNEKGQGFSTCMLNVSMFPLGSYEIKWRAGCLDIDGCYWSLNSSSSGPVFTVH